MRRLCRALVFVALAGIAAAGCNAFDDGVRDSPGAPELPLSPTPSSEEAPNLEADIESQINGIREDHALVPLNRHEGLGAIARTYSCRMGAEDFFAHESPEGETVADRVEEAGIAVQVVGENLAWLSGIAEPATSAVEGWMESEGHRENILMEEYRETGVGACLYDGTWYFTQIFAVLR